MVRLVKLLRLDYIDSICIVKWQGLVRDGFKKKCKNNALSWLGGSSMTRFSIKKNLVLMGKNKLAFKQIILRPNFFNGKPGHRGPTQPA